QFYYDVLFEVSTEYYEEFIQLFPYDPLSDRIRFLLGNWRQAAAWHRAVLGNVPVADKSFRDSFPDSPYARSALKLQTQPKSIPLMQFTRLTKPATNIGLSHPHAPSLASSNAATLPGKGSGSISGDRAGKHMPASTSGNPRRGNSQFHDSGALRRAATARFPEAGALRRAGGGIGGHSGPRFSPSHSSFASMGHGGGFRRR